MATKYGALLQCWPGLKPPNQYQIAEQGKALALLGQLAALAPQDEDDL